MIIFKIYQPKINNKKKKIKYNKMIQLLINLYKIIQTLVIFFLFIKKIYVLRFIKFMIFI